MKVLSPKKKTEGFRYPEDIDRIYNVLEREGFSITKEEIDEIWNLYSEDRCAGWLYLPEDNEIIDIILEYSDLTEFEDSEMFGLDMDIDVLKDQLEELTDLDKHKLKVLLTELNLT